MYVCILVKKCPVCNSGMNNKMSCSQDALAFGSLKMLIKGVYTGVTSLRYSSLRQINSPAQMTKGGWALLKCQLQKVGGGGGRLRFHRNERPSLAHDVVVLALPWLAMPQITENPVLAKV